MEHVIGEALRAIVVVSIVASSAIGVWALVFEAIDAHRYSRTLHAAKARAPFSSRP
jgi:hypothetical protein